MHRLFGSRALAIVAVSLISVVGGALLAWWQWTRYESASGTLQNLGYVLQWPLFGVFPGFMFWRIHRSAQRERAFDEEAKASDGDAATTPAEPERPTSPVSAQLDPRATYTQNRTVTYAAGEDQELLAYNQRLARLAQLADREQHHAG